MARSTCTPVIQQGSHVFDISGYSVHKATCSGEPIKSGTFSIGGHDWNVVFFPNNLISSVAAQGGAVQPCVSVYLALMSKGAKVHASCDLGLVDHTTGLPSSVHRTSEPREFRYGDASMYFPQSATAFMACAQLEASVVYLQDDRLTVYCDIAVVKKPSVFTTNNMFAGRVEAPPSNITEHLAKLLETGEGADVTFLVGGETIVAHKWLLAARSPVFRAELCGPMRAAAAKHVAVHDVQPDVFRALLHFIYTDSLPPDTTDDLWGYSDNRMIHHLLVAANWYGVDRLKLMCEGFLCDNLDPGNAASTLALAYYYNCPKLKNLCFRLITDPKTMEAARATPGYTDLKTIYPCILADALEFKTSNLHRK